MSINWFAWLRKKYHTQIERMLIAWQTESRDSNIAFFLLSFEFVEIQAKNTNEIMKGNCIIRVCELIAIAKLHHFVIFSWLGHWVATTMGGMCRSEFIFECEAIDTCARISSASSWTLQICHFSDISCKRNLIEIGWVKQNQRRNRAIRIGENEFIHFAALSNWTGKSQSQRQKGKLFEWANYVLHSIWIAFKI